MYRWCVSGPPSKDNLFNAQTKPVLELKCTLLPSGCAFPLQLVHISASAVAGGDHPHNGFTPLMNLSKKQKPQRHSKAQGVEGHAGTNETAVSADYPGGPAVVGRPYELQRQPIHLFASAFLGSCPCRIVYLLTGVYMFHKWMIIHD